MNLGIGGERVENVLWRVNDVVLPSLSDQSLFTVVTIISTPTAQMK